MAGDIQNINSKYYLSLLLEINKKIYVSTCKSHIAFGCSAESVNFRNISKIHFLFLAERVYTLNNRVKVCSTYLYLFAKFSKFALSQINQQQGVVNNRNQS